MTAAAPSFDQEADDRETIDGQANASLPAAASRIPNVFNALILIAQVAAVFAFLRGAAVVTSIGLLILLSAAFAVFMMSVFSSIHEAEHGTLFSNEQANAIGGIIASSFFPAPFHLLRQGHIGHHLRNRSDDEAFDFWFDGESPAWKWVQWIGILTGFFYVMVVLSNVIVLGLPFLLKRRWFAFDRPSAAFMDSINPRYARIIQAEACGIIVLHGLMIWLMRIPIGHYLALYGAFGFLWSAMQYVHHYATERHITRGARNLWIFWPIDKLWLNHNWHRLHHLHPTVSWIHLNRLGKQTGDDRRFLPWAYLKMWAGPRKAKENVRNRFAGKIIR